MIELVTRIHLFDRTYQQRINTIEVNQQMELPDWMVDDRMPQVYAPYFELKGRTVSPGGTEAQYAHNSAPPIVVATRLTYLLKLSVPGSGLELVHVGIPWGDLPGLSMSTEEPECACDIRALMSSGHNSGCQYLQWKRSK